MNADEVVRALKECGDCDNCPYYSCWIDEETGDPADACNDGRLFKDILSLIESLQSQLAESQRRERAAVEDLNTLRKKSRWTCFACKYDASYVREICAGCGYNDNWQWRGDAEEGDGE